MLRVSEIKRQGVGKKTRKGEDGAKRQDRKVLTLTANLIFRNGSDAAARL